MTDAASRNKVIYKITKDFLFMVKVLIYLKKNIDQNASIYYDKAKKTHKKTEGARRRNR